MRFVYDLYASMHNACSLGVVFFLIDVEKKNGNRFQKHHLVFGGVYLCVSLCVCWGWWWREVILFFLHSSPLGLEPPATLLPKKGVSRQWKGGRGVCGVCLWVWSFAAITGSWPVLLTLPVLLSSATLLLLLQNVWQNDLQTFNLLIYDCRLKQLNQARTIVWNSCNMVEKFTSSSCGFTTE